MFKAMCGVWGVCKHGSTYDFCRCWGGFLHREEAGHHKLEQWGQKKQRQDADDIHGTDGQQKDVQVKVGVHRLYVVTRRNLWQRYPLPTTDPLFRFVTKLNGDLPV